MVEPKIYETARVIPKGKHLVMGPDSFIGDFVLVTVPSLYLGKGSQINAGSKITGRKGVTIGDDVVVGYDVKIMTSTDTPAGVFMNDARPLKQRKLREGKVFIEDGCLIGSNSIIMPGVQFAPRTVVRAFSYVDKKRPTLTTDQVIGGQPAKHVRNRNQDINDKR